MLQLIFRIWQQLVSLQETLNQLIPGPATKIVFIAELDGEILFGVEKMDLRSDQQVTLSIQPVDRRGNPAPVDGVPEWGSSNTDLVTLTVATDGMSAVAVAVGPIGGPATVSVQADADLGTGVVALVGTLEINITAGRAVSMVINAGTPEDQPPVEPPPAPPV